MRRFFIAGDHTNTHTQPTQCQAIHFFFSTETVFFSAQILIRIFKKKLNILLQHFPTALFSIFLPDCSNAFILFDFNIDLIPYYCLTKNVCFVFLPIFFFRLFYLFFLSFIAFAHTITLLLFRWLERCVWLKYFVEKLVVTKNKYQWTMKSMKWVHSS